MTTKVVIGITGNIGTGKTLVLRMLQELGVTVLDTDKIVHQLMKQGTPVHQAVAEQFGKFVLDGKGDINRKVLGRIAFVVPEVMAKLEEIIHPVVRQVVIHRIDKAPTEAVAVEAIKLFEGGLEKYCDTTWVITSSPETQLKRLVERLKLPPEIAKQRINSQPPQEEKAAKADVVIDNDDELVKTWGIVKAQFTALMKAKTGAVQQTPPATKTKTATPSAATNINTSDVTIRRAKREDLDVMANLISAGTNNAITPDISQMMESLFTRAYIVASVNNGQIVGMAGWQTENLIAGIEDFHMMDSGMWATVGSKMLEMIHSEVNSLSCEVAIIFIHNNAGSAPIEFFKQQDYEQSEPKKLGYMWKDAAEEWLPDNSILLFKKLREQRIMVPM